MDIALAAHRWGIAQGTGHRFDHVHQLLLGVGLGLAAQFTQGFQRQGAAGPSAIVLGREVGASQLVQVGVDVGRGHGVTFAIGIHVLEQVLAGQLPAFLHGTCQARIADLDVVLHAALATEVEGDGVAMDFGVPVAQGGKAVGLVALGVLGIANADEGGIQQADDRSHDLFPAQASPGEILFHALAQLGQGLTEGQHPLVLVGVADLPPAGVIAILLAAASIATGGLQVAVGIRTDPYLGIGRRNGQLVDALDLGLVADALAVRCEIGPFAAQLAPTQARLTVVDVAEVGRQGGAEGGTGVITLVIGDGQVGLGETLHYFRARGHDYTDVFLVETVDSRKRDRVLMTALKPTDAQLRDALLAKAAARRPGTTFCPSEVARDLAADWRPLMEPLRHAARELARDGRLRVTQKGEPLDAEVPWQGPIRLSLA